MSSNRTRWATIGATIAISLGAGGGFGLARATISSGERTVLVPITPCRLTDTRSTIVDPRNTPLGPGETYTLGAHGSNGECVGIPTDAIALQLNMTALDATERTFFTVWGDGAQPNASSLNPEPGEPPTPNAVTTDLTADGRFNVFNAFGTVNAIVDITGYYVDHVHDDRYYTEAESDGRYYSRADSDARYYDKSTSDARYVRRSSRIVVPAVAFQPANFSYGFIPGDIVALSGPQCFWAPLSLPEGATITSVTAVVSNTNVGDAPRVRLFRSRYADSTSSITDIPPVADQTVVLNTASIPRHITDDTINDPVVDNGTFYYTAQMCGTAGDGLLAYFVELAG